MNATSNSNTKLPPTPSPNSTDEPFPSIEEMKRVSNNIDVENSLYEIKIILLSGTFSNSGRK